MVDTEIRDFKDFRSCQWSMLLNVKLVCKDTYIRLHFIYRPTFCCNNNIVHFSVIGLCID